MNSPGRLSSPLLIGVAIFFPSNLLTLHVPHLAPQILGTSLSQSNSIIIFTVLIYSLPLS